MNLDKILKKKAASKIRTESGSCLFYLFYYEFI